MCHCPDICSNAPLPPACSGPALAAARSGLRLFSSHSQPLPEVAARRDLLAAFRSRHHV